MLASSGFGYDSLLAHAPAKESLPKRVVNLVRSCMVQVLPLQVDFWSPILAVHTTIMGNSRMIEQRCTGLNCIDNVVRLTSEKHSKTVSSLLLVVLGESVSMIQG